MSLFKNMDNLFFNQEDIEDAVNSTIRAKKRGRGNMIKRPDELNQDWNKAPEDARSVLLRAAYHGIRYYDNCVKKIGGLVCGSDMRFFRAYASKLEPETASLLATTIVDVYKLQIKDISDLIFQPLVFEFDELHDRFLSSRMPNYTGLILDGRKLDRRVFRKIITTSDSEYTSCRVTMGTITDNRNGVTKTCLGFNETIKFFECGRDIPEEVKKHVGDTPLGIRVVNVEDDFLVLHRFDNEILALARRKSDILNYEHIVLLV